MSTCARWVARLHYSCGTVTPRDPRPASPRLRRLTAALGVLLIVAACGAQTQGSPAASDAASAPADTNAPSTGTESGAPSAGPSITPAGTPGPTPILHNGFHYSDILKIGVNRLAARVAPTRTAALVHGYDVSGPAPIDKGQIRLNKGDYVSVELGPLPIGDTVWYLVWPAPGAKLHPGGTEWYTTPPMAGAPLPGWVAASVGSAVYMALQRRPDQAEIDATGSVGVTAAGVGDYVSGPQQRHDVFQFGWAAAAPVSGTACAFKVELVPPDADFDPKVAITTSTTTVKVSPLGGSGVSAPWLPADTGSWETFTVNVTSTCNWAIHLVRLEHD